MNDLIKAQASKCSYSTPRLTILGIMAGIFIALGANASNMVMHNITNVSIARFLAGLVFPIGLIMIVNIKGELFTGDCLMTLPLFNDQCGLKDVCRVLVTVWVSNFMGCIIIALLANSCGQFDYSNGMLGAYTIKVALSKINIPISQAISSGILCNIYVCAAVIMASKSTDIVGKIISVFCSICVFVLCGFEHCVANMYYIPAGLIAMHTEKYVKLTDEIYGINISSLNIISMMSNIIPVTIGNIIGGVGFVAIPLYLTSNVKKKETH